MLDERLEGRVLEPEVRARIVQSAQGVPLFLEQMLAMLEGPESISAEDVPPAISALASCPSRIAGARRARVAGAESSG